MTSLTDLNSIIDQFINSFNDRAISSKFTLSSKQPNSKNDMPDLDSVFLQEVELLMLDQQMTN